MRPRFINPRDATEAAKAAVREALAQGRITKADVDEGLNIYGRALAEWEQKHGLVRAASVARLEHAAREMARPAPAGGDDA